MVQILMGIGNDLLSDDGAGPVLARMTDIDGWKSLDAGTVPENFTKMIRDLHPDRVVIVDAAEMNLPAGSIRIIPHEKITETGLGTHQIPLIHFIRHISPFTAEILFIGIQPRTLEPGDDLSPEISTAISLIHSLIVDNQLQSIEIYGRGA